MKNSLIENYSILDFKNESIDKLSKKKLVHSKLHSALNNLKEWMKDEEYFLSFVESIQEEYIFLIHKYEEHDIKTKKDKAIIIKKTIPKILIVSKEVYSFLEKVLEANKNLDYSFSFYNFKKDKVCYDNTFYFFSYDNSNKDIFLYNYKMELQRIGSIFHFKRMWQKYSYILKKDNDFIIKKDEKFFKKRNCDHIFGTEILRTYYFNKINTPILKDLKRLPEYIQNMIKADFNLLRSSNNIQEFIEKIFKKKIAFNLNKLDLFTAYSFAILLNFIKENEKNKFYQFLLDLKNRYLNYYDDLRLIANKNIPSLNSYFTDWTYENIKHKRSSYDVLNLLFIYFIHKLKTDKLEDKQLIKDYVDIIYKSNATINLNINSIKRIKQEHDISMREYGKILLKSKVPKNKRLKINKAFTRLELPHNFSLLKTEEELFLQGEKQHNCVYTRKENVNKGISAIYNLNYKDKDYTLELQKNGNNEYVVFELKGKYNEEPTNEIKFYVKERLKEIQGEEYA